MTLEAGLKEMLRQLVREEVRAALAEAREAVPMSTSPASPAEYLSAAEVADLVGLSTESLKSMRARGEGPPFVRVARRAVRYARVDVEAWLKTRTVGRRVG